MCWMVPRKMYQHGWANWIEEMEEGCVRTHVHGCIVCEKESGSRSSCLCSVSLGGEGVLRPGCGSWAVDCGTDGGEGEGLRMCCFGCVSTAAGIGEFMLQECNDCWILQRRVVQW